MVDYSVVYCHTKKFKKTGQGHFCLVSKGTRRYTKILKAIHEENDVLTDNELIVARDFFKKSKYACPYIQNEFPRGFKLLNHI